MSYNEIEYSIKIEAVSKDEQTKEMICDLITGHHVCQVKIPISQFEQLKRDGFFTLKNGKMSSDRFVDVPGYVSQNDGD